MRQLAAENKDGTAVFLRGPWLARWRCRRFGRPRLAKIAGMIYCPRCGAVLPLPLPPVQPGFHQSWCDGRHDPVMTACPSWREPALLARIELTAELSSRGRSVCRACGLPGTTENPLMDYEHDQGCMIYLPSGNCDCGRPGYVAHKFRCPIHVEGDRAPKKEWGRND